MAARALVTLSLEIEHPRISCAGSGCGSTVAAWWLVLVSSTCSFNSGHLEGALVSADGLCQSPLPVVPGAIHWYDGGCTGGGADG